MDYKVIDTNDGSKTIYLPAMDEQYHSVNGAITESEHVFLKNGYLYHQSTTPKVFEVGFGTGLNCLLTALKAEELKRSTTYYSIEKYPLKKQITEQLNYGLSISSAARELFEKIHSCKWNETVSLTEYFQLRKIKADLLTDNLRTAGIFNIIYFDAFAPDKQPEMWNTDVFEKIYSLTTAKGVFVTYSAKGIVRRQLAACGFDMEKLPGPPGKFQMLRGIKTDLNA